MAPNVASFIPKSRWKSPLFHKVLTQIILSYDGGGGGGGEEGGGRVVGLRQGMLCYAS